MLNDVLAVCVPGAVVVVIATILGAVELRLFQRGVRACFHRSPKSGARYPSPTDEDWLAAFILLGRFAYAVSWRHTYLVHISTVIPRRESCTV
jgi:hypothetical protein